MEDNLQQPTPPEKPEIQEAQIVPTPIVKKQRAKRESILDQLPPSIRGELDQIILHKSPQVAKKWMMENHLSDFTTAANLSVQSYKTYKTNHRKRILEEMELVNKLATPNPAIMNIIDNFGTPGISIDDKRNALKYLFNGCEEQKKLIASKQTGFLDPMLSGLILANTKMQVTIIEKSAVLGEQIAKDSERDLAGEMMTFYKVILAAVDNCYKMANGTTNYDKFRHNLDEFLTPTLKNYRHVKEAVLEAEAK